MSVGENAAHVYAMAMEADLRRLWNNLDGLVQARAEMERWTGRVYGVRAQYDARIAELQGPAKLPRPRYQTDVQRRVAVCPRCRQREEQDAA